MPIYEYRCNDCSKGYDVYHKVREVVDDVVCPSCGSSNHTRMLSAPTVMTGKASYAEPQTDAGSQCSSPDGCCRGMCELN